MPLKKDEWVIRKTSGITIETANSYIRGQLDAKQDDDTNVDVNSGAYTDFFFADLFDSRDGSLYRIWSVGATNDGSVIAGDSESGDSYYTIVRTSEYVTAADLADFITNEAGDARYLQTTEANTTYATKVELPDLTDYRIEDEIVQIVDNKIASIQIDEVIIG